MPLVQGLWARERNSLIIRILVYSVAFVLLALAVNALIVPSLAEHVADATSQWVTMPIEDFNDFFYNNGASAGNWQIILATDGETASFRDLTIYYRVKTLKLPCAVLIYLIGALIICVASHKRALSYVDAVSQAVRSFSESRDAAIKLPAELSGVQSDLELVRARVAADSHAATVAEERKNELVAYIAHDIKSPLTAVIGYLSLLEEAPELPDETRRRYAAIARERAEHLDGLVNDFFEITRYNLQSIPLERETVDVGLLCRQVADGFMPQTAEKGVGLVVEAADSVTAFIDPEKMARVISNVLRNAVAYAHERTVIRVAVREYGQTVQVTVVNQGREISPEHLESIFERFYREDPARSGGKGGTGLGLAIARELVVAHGGTITARSEGGYTTFTVEIPAGGGSRFSTAVTERVPNGPHGA